MDQIDTIKSLWIKLKYSVNNRDQIHNLPFSFLLLSIMSCQLIKAHVLL